MIMFELKYTDPEKAGFDKRLLDEAANILDEGVGEGIYPGGVLWVARKGVTAKIHSTGYTDFDNKIPVDENTLYDLASLTKPIATASTILLMCRDGLLDLKVPITEYFPEWDIPHLENVTIHHLLTHTSGLPAWVDLYSNGQDRDQAIKELLNTPLVNEPGDEYKYSCLGYIILSLIAENVTGSRLDALADRYVFKPLDMLNTMYNPNKGKAHTIAATDNCPKREGKLIGEVHDGNAYILGGVSGNAGLFSNATDLAKYCHSITNTNASNSNVPFDSSVLSQMFTNMIPEKIGGQTYGWFTYPNDMLPGSGILSKCAIGHSGFTGTVVIIDPQNELFCIILTNRVCRQGDGECFMIQRRRVINAVMSAIVC